MLKQVVVNELANICHQYGYEYSTYNDVFLFRSVKSKDWDEVWFDDLISVTDHVNILLNKIKDDLSK